MEWMLHAGANLRLHTFERLGQGLERALSHLGDGAAALGHMQHDVAGDLLLGLRLHDLGALFHADVARIEEGHALLTMQNLMRVGHVAVVGRSRVQAVHQARVGIDADVGLHAEEPLVALFGLVQGGLGSGLPFPLSLTRIKLIPRDQPADLRNGQPCLQRQVGHRPPRPRIGHV